MSFFDEEDPFEDIIKEFFGSPSSGFRRADHREIISGEAEEREIDLIETDKKIFLIFSLPGYEKKDISVKVHGGFIKIKAKRLSSSGVQGYLSNKLNKGISIEKKLPKKANSKRFSYAFKNGILEVAFDKK